MEDLKDKTTFELLQRLKKIEIEKWNLGVETVQIMEELWRRVDALEKTQTLNTEVERVRERK
jgi:hypothetical protein